jgi:hypothetical protein
MRIYQLPTQWPRVQGRATVTTRSCTLHFWSTCWMYVGQAAPVTALTPLATCFVLGSITSFSLIMLQAARAIEAGNVVMGDTVVCLC